MYRIRLRFRRRGPSTPTPKSSVQRSRYLSLEAASEDYSAGGATLTGMIPETISADAKSLLLDS